MLRWMYCLCRVSCFVSRLLMSLLCGGWCVGCHDSNYLNMDIPMQIPAIVVEGYLTEGHPCEITISRNNLMDDELIFQSVWNASVSLSDGQDTLSLLNIYYTNVNRSLLVNYRHDTSPEKLLGDTLNLSIATKDGDWLTAQTPRLSKITICEAIKRENDLLIRGDVVNNCFSGYLRVDGCFYDSKANPVRVSKFFDCTSAMLPNVLLPWPAGLSDLDSVKITVFHIHEAYFRYQQSVDHAVNAYHDPFFVPENIQSNIKGGIGIFTHYTLDSCWVKDK